MIESDISCAPDTNLTDSLLVIAKAFAALDTSEDVARVHHRILIENSLKRRAARVAKNDLTDLEVMLTAQAQFLHHIFARTVKDFAAEPGQEKHRHQTNLALRVQQSCRMTISALKSLKSRGKIEYDFSGFNNKLLLGK